MKFLYMHTFCPLPIERFLQVKAKYFVKTPDILKSMNCNVQIGFQIELVACRHNLASDKLLFLPCFA